MSGIPYYFSELISLVAILVSLAGIYLANEIPYRRARKKFMKIINMYLIPLYNTEKGENKSNNLWKKYVDGCREIPVLPVILLIIYLAISLIWNNSVDIGLYNFLITHLLINDSSAFSISLPFIITTIFYVFFGYKLSYPHISFIINTKNEIYNNNFFLFLLKIKRYELYFLSVTLALSFFFFTKTFSYLIYRYPNFTLPALRSFGTLRSYDSNGLIYSAVSTLALGLIAYLTPEFFLNLKMNHKNVKKFQSIKNLPELENLIFEKSGIRSKLYLLIIDVGGNSYIGNLIYIGEFLGIEKSSSPGRYQYIRWEYISSIAVINQ